MFLRFEKVADTLSYARRGPAPFNGFVKVMQAMPPAAEPGSSGIPA